MWHIGQKVIYIGDDPDYPKGVREIVSIRKAPCGCNYLDIDTGVGPPPNYHLIEGACSTCSHKEVSKIYWKRHTAFRPVDFAEDVIAEIEKQVKEETVEI